MTDAEILDNGAFCYPLATLGAELDRCSPELRRLVRMACSPSFIVRPYVRLTDAMHAQLRLGEAVTTRTKEAKAARKAA